MDMSDPFVALVQSATWPTVKVITNVLTDFAKTYSTEHFPIEGNFKEVGYAIARVEFLDNTHAD